MSPQSCIRWTGNAIIFREQFGPSSIFPFLILMRRWSIIPVKLRTACQSFWSDPDTIAALIDPLVNQCAGSTSTVMQRGPDTFHSPEERIPRRGPLRNRRFAVFHTDAFATKETVANSDSQSIIRDRSSKFLSMNSFCEVTQQKNRRKTIFALKFFCFFLAVLRGICFPSEENDAAFPRGKADFVTRWFTVPSGKIPSFCLSPAALPLKGNALINCFCGIDKEFFSSTL